MNKRPETPPSPFDDPYSGVRGAIFHTEAHHGGFIDVGGRKCTDALVLALQEQGVEYIFGIPGEENLDLVESLRTSDIKLVLTRHEQAAGFMAATIGRLTGRPGVCLSTLGPGATNFPTALAYSLLGGMSMFVLTGQKPIRHSKQGLFQIIDVIGHFAPLTKFNARVQDPGAITSLLAKCFACSMREKPGPTHLELPQDIAGMDVSPGTHVHPKITITNPVPDEEVIESAMEKLMEARRPLLCIGAGANRQDPWVIRDFMRTTGIHAVCTQMGKGVVDELDPCFLGTAALSSNDWIHAAVEKSDLIITVGHDVIEKPPFFMQYNKPPIVIHVNFSPSIIDEVFFPHLDLVGDIGKTMELLTTRLRQISSEKYSSKFLRWDHSLFQHVREKSLKSMYNSEYRKSDSVPMSVQRIVADTQTSVPEDAILCLDNGMYKISYARAYQARQPNTVMLDNALATMGAGLPSAIAAKLINPNRVVLAICGDGGFMMNSQEIETAVRLRVQIIIIVLDNNGFGMIAMKQSMEGFKNYGMDLGNPDFKKYAESYGAVGYTVKEASDFSRFLKICVTEGSKEMTPETKTVHLIHVPMNYDTLDKELNIDLLEDINELRKELDILEQNSS